MHIVTLLSLWAQRIVAPEAKSVGQVAATYYFLASLLPWAQRVVAQNEGTWRPLKSAKSSKSVRISSQPVRVAGRMRGHLRWYVVRGLDHKGLVSTPACGALAQGLRMCNAAALRPLCAHAHNLGASKDTLSKMGAS